MILLYNRLIAVSLELTVTMIVQSVILYQSCVSDAIRSPVVPLVGSMGALMKYNDCY